MAKNPFRVSQLLAYVERVQPTLDDLNYFELLDITQDATAPEIQEAFHRTAGRLHPDRYRTALTPEQHEALTIVYARVAQAYQTLRHDGKRQKYIESRSNTRDEPNKAVDPESLMSPKSRKSLQRARAQLRTSDVSSAILTLKMALAADPNSAVLKAALAEAKNRLKQAR